MHKRGIADGEGGVAGVGRIMRAWLAVSSFMDGRRAWSRRLPGSLAVAWLAAMLVGTQLSGGALASISAGTGASAPSTASFSAATGDVGYRDQHFSGTGTAVTGAKPESKLWWNDGFWWASMWDEVSQDNHIFRLNSSTQAWMDTGVVLDTRSGTRADTLWDGTKLYVASHGFTNTAAAGLPSNLYRLSYNAAADTYTKDAGFPVTINNWKTESLVLDKDSAGHLWATWVQEQKVYVTATTTDDRTWGTPFALPFSGATGLTTDDISSLIAFNGRVGVMWSNQNTHKFSFAVHVDGDPLTTWQPVETALSGPLAADDHINLKKDSSGRVYAAVKTSKTTPQDPLVELLVRDPATGSWSDYVFGRVSDHHTRPIVLVDEANGRVRLFATSAETGGVVYEKTAPISNIAFPAGTGTPFIRDGGSADMNDATSTKQILNAATGLVVMGSNDSMGYFWHNASELGAATLMADFNGSPASGPAPLAVGFTDTSSGNATSWSWEFGDGATSSQQNPTHTYSSPGTYAVSLTVSDESGSDTIARPSYISVTPPTEVIQLTPTADAYVNSTSATSNFGAASTLRVKAGSTTSPQQLRSYLKFVVSGLSGVTVTSAKLRLFVVDPAANGGVVYDAPSTWEEGTLTWSDAPPPSGSALATVGPATLDAWVDVTIPASAFATGNGTYTLAVQSNSPTDGTSWYNSREGANPPQLVLGLSSTPEPPIAAFSGSPTSGAAPLAVALTDASTGNPTSWSWDFGDGTTSTLQNPTHTYSTPGTYTVSLTVSNAGGSNTATQANYISVTVPPPPVASFSGSPTSGPAPLTVNVTDTSTGNPTSWSWSFGDGATSTQQHPTHTYTTPGTYTVSLTATNLGGSTTETRTDYVEVAIPPPPVASFTGAPTSGQALLTVNFSDTSTGNPVGWSWDFGDGGTSAEQNPSHTYSTAGTYTVSLTATNAGGGNTFTRTDYITVSSPPSSVTFAPVADSDVRNLSPDKNYGAQPTLRVKNGGTSSENYRTYLKFSVTGLVGTVTSAKLRLYVTDPANDGGGIYAVSDDWTEMALTWNNAPVVGGTALGQIGAANLDTWVEVTLPASTFAGGNGVYNFAVVNAFASGTVWYSSRETLNAPQLVLGVS